jgi:hypothetical protein
MYPRFFVYLLCFILTQTWTYDAAASETDSFTGRCAPLADTTTYLSDFVTGGIEKAVARANYDAHRRYLRTNYPFRARQGVDYCNSEDLYRHIRFLFARKFIGQMEAHINHLPEGMKRTVDLDHSVYRDFPFAKSPTLVGTRNMGSVVRIGNHIVGADKFGHFFSEGWTSYRLAYREPVPDFSAALEYGEITESLYYGVMTTGIYSHADLVANFHGMRFYNAIVGNKADPLGPDRMPEAYVRCLNNKWARVRDFNWTDYVDGAWDEGVNYNFFKDEDLLVKAVNRMEKELRSQPGDCGCKNRGDETGSLFTKYRNFSVNLLNLSGHSILPDSLKAQTLLKKKMDEILSRLSSEKEK